MIKKQTRKPLFSRRIGKREIKVTKPMVEWFVLLIIVLLIPLGFLSGLFSFGYNYVKCGDLPLELDGSYYRIPGDTGYGIHGGSNYSNCSYSNPPGVQRDPSTKMGAKLAKEARAAVDFSHAVDGYGVYVPKGYVVTALGKSQLGDGIATSYFVTTNNQVKFEVREVNKNSNYSYTNLCTRPAEKYWSGKVIGKDSQGREVCRAISRYVTSYVVGINIGATGVTLEAPLDKNSSEELLDSEAIAIFSAMTPYTQ